MSAIDLLISNGTCFYAPGVKATDNIIPCGNSAGGAYQCCEEGDFCLEYNICYNTNHSTTYMAGCTDEEFTSPSCPGKGSMSNQELLNMVQCAGSESGGSVVWSACPGPATRTKIGAPQACTCSDADNGILTAATSIPAIASLPTATGETISFASGHTPVRKSTVIVTSTAVNGQQTTMTVATAVSTAGSSTPSSTSSSSSSGLSTGAKAGIGVGAAALGIGLIALAAFFFTWHRRKHAKGGAGGDAAYQPATAPGPEAYQSPPPQYASPGYQYNQPVSPMAAAAPMGYNPGHAGFKSELPAEGEVKPAFKSELPAGNLDTATSQALSLDRNGTPSLISVAASSPAPTGHASMISDVSSDGYGRGHNNGGNIMSIAELHG